MKFSFLEQFGAAILICAWLIYGVNFIGDTLVSAEPHAVAGAAGEHVADESEKPLTDKQLTTMEEELDLSALLGAADPAAGKKVFGKCKSCHTVDEGGKNKVGPNLWNVVGRPKGSAEGFSYSGAVSGLGGEWTYEDLFVFLKSPKAFAPGNKMTFGGLKKTKDRAAVIGYLREQSGSPKPLP